MLRTIVVLEISGEGVVMRKTNNLLPVPVCFVDVMVFLSPSNKDTLCFTISDFLSQTDLPAAAEWGWKLEELGVSRVQPDADVSELTKVLIEEGIPRIPAADIVRSAARFFVKQHNLTEKPLAIFWDAENVRIPADLSARNAYERMRKTLSRFGVPRDLFVYQDQVQVFPRTLEASFRLVAGFASILLISILSGGNAKEVADKMIIVDSLLYCMNHQVSGATLCFITSDRDFSYLLSKLRGFPEIRTVVVHNVGTNVKSCNLLRSAANHCLSWTMFWTENQP